MDREGVRRQVAVLDDEGSLMERAQTRLWRETTWVASSCSLRVSSCQTSVSLAQLLALGPPHHYLLTPCRSTTSSNSSVAQWQVAAHLEIPCDHYCLDGISDAVIVLHVPASDLTGV